MAIVMSWDIAEWLGARAPATVQDHRDLKRSGSDLPVRTRESLPMFWPIKLDPRELHELTHRST
jgi:hypothetical protein